MVSVLLLNASYEPLHVLDLRRAMGLIFAEKVELVEAVRDREIRSVSARHPLPSVIRLRHYVRVPQRHATWSRRGVMVRDKYTCVYCGVKLTARAATLDHIIPQWQCRERDIPANTWSNTVAACARCQTRKGGRAMHHAGMRFHDPSFEPKMPRVSYLVVTSDIRPEWKRYIEI